MSKPRVQLLLFVKPVPALLFRYSLPNVGNAAHECAPHHSMHLCQYLTMVVCDGYNSFESLQSQKTLACECRHIQQQYIGNGLFCCDGPLS